MNRVTKILLLTLAALAMAGTPVLALDEGALTPTKGKAIAGEEQEFHAAMAVWFGHKYTDGEKLLRKFSKKHPDSPWAAEADLHIGCNLVYQKKHGEARKIFEKLIAKHPDSNIAVKAKVRLGNIAEATGDFSEAVKQYSEILDMDPTPAQFRYANYNARLAMMKDHRRQALINCGPVALAACLDAIGKIPEALSAKALRPDDQGLSLARLQDEAQNLGVRAIAIEMSLAQLKKAKLPVLAHINPSHYVAVLAVSGDKVRLEDSIRGKYETTLSELGPRWSGKVLAFNPSSDVTPLSASESQKTLGGCCGHTFESECSGANPDCSCNQPTAGGGGNGPRGGCSTCGGSGMEPLAAGSPQWKFNTITLNLIVQDTPIWYDPGKGPQIAFTLSYSNENSDTGIFGLGWRSPYDMRVFFLPSEIPYDPPSLQVYRADGRIETYDWSPNSGSPRYLPRYNTMYYGYTDTIEKLTDGTIVLTLRSGGKYYFRAAGSTPVYAEGRIWKIEDDLGNVVECFYDGTTGWLDYIEDANDEQIDIDYALTATEELVSSVTLPDGRHADFLYTDGNLTSITDMGGYESTLEYDAAYATDTPQTYPLEPLQASPPLPDDGSALMLHSTNGLAMSGAVKVTYSGESEVISYEGKYHNQQDDLYLLGITRGTSPISAPDGQYAGTSVTLPWTNSTEAVTISPLSPDDSGTDSLSVVSTEGFPSKGLIKVNGSEIMSYTGTTSTTLTGIHRGIAAAASSGATVQMWRSAPYLSGITTLSRKVMFTYMNGSPQGGSYWQNGPTVHLHEAYECGASETLPSVPTWHMQWCWDNSNSNGLFAWPGLAVTHYPTSVTHNQQTSECIQHWTGGLTKKYYVANDIMDEIVAIEDETGQQVVSYDYNESVVEREPGSSIDANGNRTKYQYDSTSGQMLTRSYVWNTDQQGGPLWAMWVYQYQDEFPFKLTAVGNADTSTPTDDDDVTYGGVAHHLVYRNVYGPVGGQGDDPNDDNQLIKVMKKGDTGAAYTSEEYGYNSQRRVAWSRAYRNAADYTETRYIYDANIEPRGFLTSIDVGPTNDESTTSYHYDTKGRRDAVTDPNGNTTWYVYDDLDRVTKIIYPLADDQTPEDLTDHPYKETHYTCCHMDWQKDENGRQTDYTYDSKNRLHEIEAPDAGTTVYTYDSAILDRVVTVTDALGHETNYEYYPTGKTKKVTYGDGTWEAYEYDPVGNVTRKSDSAGKVTTYVYDWNNHLSWIQPWDQP